MQHAKHDRRAAGVFFLALLAPAPDEVAAQMTLPIMADRVCLAVVAGGDPFRAIVKGNAIERRFGATLAHRDEWSATASANNPSDATPAATEAPANQRRVLTLSLQLLDECQQVRHRLHIHPGLDALGHEAHPG